MKSSLVLHKGLRRVDLPRIIALLSLRKHDGGLQHQLRLTSTVPVAMQIDENLKENPI